MFMAIAPYEARNDAKEDDTQDKCNAEHACQVRDEIPETHKGEACSVEHDQRDEKCCDQAHFLRALSCLQLSGKKVEKCVGEQNRCQVEHDS